MPRPISLVLPLLVVLASCSTTTRAPAPARPVPFPSEAPSTGTVTPLPRPMEEAPAPPVLEPARKPAPPRLLADGAQLPAVRGLLAAADAALAKGDVELAAVNLERAQRLAPQSATVYQRLAAVRLRQKRPAEAEQLARKALGYASAPAQQASLWLVIANARQMRGLHAEAQEARARAAALQQAVTAP